MPVVGDVNEPCHVTGPWTLSPALPKLGGTGNARPERNTSSLPERGTMVVQALLLNVVDAQVAFGSKTICALATARVYVWSAVKVIVELLNEIVAPVLGIPLAVRFALNQIKVPPWMGVPLKLEALLDAGHD